MNALAFSVLKAVNRNDADRLRKLSLQATSASQPPSSAESTRKPSTANWFDVFNQKDSHGYSPLWLACSKNRRDLVELLLIPRSHASRSSGAVSAGQKIMAMPLAQLSFLDIESGWNCLHLCLYKGYLKLAQLLLEEAQACGVDLVSVRDVDGLTPFQLLAHTLHDGLNLSQRKHVIAKYGDGEEIEAMDRTMDSFASSVAASSVVSSAGHSCLAANDVDTMNLNETTRCSVATMVMRDLYTWGSNSNWVLGHADGNDRLNPDRVDLHFLLQSQGSIQSDGKCSDSGDALAQESVVYDYQSICGSPVRIQQVHLSKYHMAIITSAPHSNLCTAGVGNNGRLGHGVDETVFTLRTVTLNGLDQPQNRVVKVALGYDHTLILTVRGQVWSFGSNEFGQLGYSQVDGSSSTESLQSPRSGSFQRSGSLLDTFCQYSPRKIQSLKREKIIGIAASRIHSVAYSEETVYCWGTNQGQMGFLASGNQIEINPRMVTVLSGRIQQVACIDRATACLLANGEVIVLTNFISSRLAFPPSRLFPMPSHNPTNQPPRIIQLRAGQNEIGFLDSWGDIFICPVESDEKSAKLNLKPSRVVSRGKTPSFKDFSFGIEGNIVAVTFNGEVVISGKGRRKSRMVQKGLEVVEMRFEFQRIPNLQRIIQVAASPSGAIAAIREEQSPPLPSLPPLTESLALPPKPADDDIDIYLSDKILPAHRCILEKRSAFFCAVIGDKSLWISDQTPARLSVQLKNMQWEHFKTVHNYLYLENPTEATIFKNVSAPSPEAFIALIMNILSISNELLIDHLKHICELVLCKLVNLKNVCQLTYFAQIYNSSLLLNFCCDFIILNLDLALETNAIVVSQKDFDIFSELETRLKLRQQQAFPFTRQYLPKLLDEQIKLERQNLRARLRLSSSGDLNAPTSNNLLIVSTSLASVAENSNSFVSLNLTERTDDNSPPAESPLLSPMPNSASKEDLMFQLEDDFSGMSPPSASNRIRKPSFSQTVHQNRRVHSLPLSDGNISPFMSPKSGSPWLAPKKLSIPKPESMRKIQEDQESSTTNPIVVGSFPPKNSEPTLQSPVLKSSKKLSQKERKRLVREQESLTINPSQSPASSNPWKIPSSSPSTSMMTSLVDSTLKMKLGSSPPPIASMGSPVAYRRNDSGNDLPWKSPTLTATAWGSRSPFSPSTPPAIINGNQMEHAKTNLTGSFLDIQKQQLHEAEKTQKMKKQKKSLLRIQLEENAINQIREFYESTGVPYSGEYILIATF